MPWPFSWHLERWLVARRHPKVSEMGVELFMRGCPEMLGMRSWLFVSMGEAAGVLWVLLLLLLTGEANAVSSVVDSAADVFEVEVMEAFDIAVEDECDQLHADADGVMSV